MNTKILSAALMLLVYLSAGNSANADFQLRLFAEPQGPHPFVAGSTGNIMSVFAYTVEPPSFGDRYLNDFDFAFDFGEAGLGFSSGFINLTGVNASAFTDTNVQVSTALGRNFDLLVSANALAPNSTSVDMSAYTAQSNALKLFDLQFDIAASVPFGSDYQFNFLPGASSIFGAVNSVSGGIGTPTLISEGGSFAVTAVPEPTSLALMGAGLAGFIGSRRLKKRRAAVVKAQVAAV